MAGSKVSNFAIGDSNIQSVMLTLDKTFKGQHQVSLTNYNTTAESQVAAGSVIEIGGALYNFDSNELITGSPSDGTVYIMAVPSGDIVTCAYTNTAPTWSDSKQGWYGTGATVNNRYLEFVMKKDVSLWEYKYTIESKFLPSVMVFSGSKAIVAGSGVYTQIDLNSKTQDILGEVDLAQNRIVISENGLYSVNVFCKGEIFGNVSMQIDLRVDGVMNKKAGLSQSVWYVDTIGGTIYLYKGQILTFLGNHNVSPSSVFVEIFGEIIRVK